MPYPPLRDTFPIEEGFVRRYSFFTYACIRFDVMGEAVFSYRSLPHWGRGTASAVDRVLSYNACLRRIFHLFQLSFVPLEPYPARYARHRPHAGNAIQLSKILIAHVGNSVCFFHAFFLKVNNKTKN